MDTIRKTIYDIDLSKQLQRIFSGVLLAKNDKQANRMGVNVYQDGQEVSLSGYTVKGYFIRSGVETLILTGAIDGNTAYVDLDAKCYHKDGSFSLSVVLCRDGREQTLVIYDGKIAETNTDTIVENENTLSLADIVQQEWVTNVLNAADTAMEQAGKAAASAVEAQNILEEAAAEAQAIVDSIPPDYTEAVKKLDEKARAIFVDASGDLVHITDGAAMPVKSLITHIEPMQEGEGDSSPVNVRPIRGWNSVGVKGTGKNLVIFPYYDANKTVNGITFTVNNDGKVTAQGTATANAVFNLCYPKLNAGAYYLSGGKSNNMRLVANKQINGVDITGVFDNGNGTTLVLDAQTVLHLYIVIIAGTTVNDTFAAQLESGSTATAYELYQGQTLTADLPETVYGFDKNWTTGLVTVRRVKRKIKDLYWEAYTSVVGGYRYEAAVTNKAAGEKGLLCDNLSVVSYSVENKAETISERTGQITTIRIITAYATKAEMLAAYGEAEVVYYLAEPYTIQLTPQQMETLKGINNIWSDAGRTEVTYAADTKMYIDNLVTALVNGQKEE